MSYARTTHSTNAHSHLFVVTDITQHVDILFSFRMSLLEGDMARTKATPAATGVAGAAGAAGRPARRATAGESM